MAAIDTGLLNNWVSDQIWMDVARTASISTGSLNNWVSDQIWLDVYTDIVTSTGTSASDGTFRRTAQNPFAGIFG